MEHDTDSTARFSAMSGDAWSHNISHYYVIVPATTKLNAALMCGCLGLEIPCDNPTLDWHVNI